MNGLFKFLLLSIVLLIVFSAYADDTTACFPPCREGYLCYHGKCIEKCNPPCPPHMRCTSSGECVPVKKTRRHTGFYLSFNTGLSGGINKTSAYLDPSRLSDITYTGAGYQFSFSIGGALKENLILFMDIPSITSILAPVIKIDGTVFSEGAGNLYIDNEVSGPGIMYYFMPSNVFISASIGLANTYVGRQSPDYLSYSSDYGFGFRIRAGREWWVSRRWALGAALFYQFSRHNSGDDNYFLYGRMRSSMGGVSFTATYN